MQQVLVELSRRTGQSGAMDWLDYFLRSPDSQAKTPYLLLLGRSGVPGEQVRAEELHGAVLVYEYRMAGLGTGVFATDDVTGLRTVLAPFEIRAEVALAAVQKLMNSGAVAALVSSEGDLTRQTRFLGASTARYRLGFRMRTAPHYLELLDTLDDTLATLGPKTRRNFRSYRRRAEADLRTEFVPEVRMGREELLEINSRSTNPSAREAMLWRYSLQESEQAGAMFCGMRAQDGQWLSLIGGRRHGDTTEIDWQVNLAGLPQYSLSTVMRAYLLEHEISRGTRRLMFEGGTPHPMRHSFALGDATDVLAVRRYSTRGWGLRRFSRRLFPESNFLAAALHDEAAEWV